MKFFLQ